MKALITGAARGLGAAIAALPAGRLIGRYEGTPLPSDEDLVEVRRLLWGALGRRSGRAA